MLTIEESKHQVDIVQTQENLTLSTLKTEEEERVPLTSRQQKRTTSTGKRTNYLKGLHSKYSTEPKQAQSQEKKQTNLKKQPKTLSSSPIAEEKPMMLQAEPVQMPQQELYKIEECNEKSPEKDWTEEDVEALKDQLRSLRNHDRQLFLDVVKEVVEYHLI